MLRVMLLRHAKAEPAIPGMSDLARGLAPRGRQQAADVGQFMARHRLTPNRIQVSPSVRTRETWEGISAALTQVPSPEFDQRIYNASAETLVEIMREADAATRSLLLIGHNPGLHQAAMELIATGDLDARQRLHEKFPPGALVVIDFQLSEWSALHLKAGRLERFVTPAELETATD